LYQGPTYGPLTVTFLSLGDCIVIVIVIVIVIGGLKSRGLTNTPLVCAGKISPVEALTIPRLAMLRDVKKLSIAYSCYR
jgi:hypothetical protein